MTSSRDALTPGPLGPLGHMQEPSTFCTGGLDVIRNEAWSFYRTISGVRLHWVVEEPTGPKGTARALA